MTGDRDPEVSAGRAGSEQIGLRDQLPIEEWYASEERPKPIRDRWAKLLRLRELGVEPYAYEWESSHDLTSALAAWSGEDEGPTVRVAGRIEALRDMGKSACLHLGDRTRALEHQNLQLVGSMRRNQI